MNSVNAIQTLSGTNYKKWKQDIDICLGLMDLDIAIREDSPPEPAADATVDVKGKYERWLKANRIALLVIKRSMSDTVRGGIPDSKNAKEFLTSIHEKFKESDKAETGNLMNDLMTKRYNGMGCVREHILELLDIGARLNALEIPMSDPFLVHVALNSLPNEYSQLKSTYNAQKEKWSLNDLIAICVHEEKHLRSEIADKKVNMVTETKNNVQRPNTPRLGVNKNIKSTKGKCFFCKKPGHMKKSCQKYKKWLEKSKGKGNVAIYKGEVLVCFETNNTEFDKNSWWVDSGASIHVTNSLQGFINKRVPRYDEISVIVGTGDKAAVKFVGTVRVKLESGFILELEDVCYVPSIRRNLISVSQIVKKNFELSINDSGFIIYQDLQVVGNGFHTGGMFQLNCKDSCYVANMVGQKRLNQNEISSSLWHKRLGHISIERVKTLSKTGILPELELDHSTTCIECIKGKMVNSHKKNATRSNDLLELVHTDICGPFPNPTYDGYKYFITFIDDYSRYCHLYLLSEKSSALMAFKIYKTEVEKQLERRIKVVRSDRGGEYYGRYTEHGRNPGPFALYLQGEGIMAQYTNPGTPQQNGVSERKNRTLKDMVRSMMSGTNLPMFLWGDAIKTANYISNRVPSKSVITTPFELWYKRKPSLQHLRIWGCKAEARVYNPQERKLDPKTVSCYFVGYPQGTKGYRFYCPNHSMRFVETGKVKFVEEGSVETTNSEVMFEEETEETMLDSLHHITPSIDRQIELGHSVPVINNDVNGMQDDVHNDAATNQEAMGNAAQTHNQDVEIVSNQNAPELRKSTRLRRPAISDDFVVYLSEADIDIGEPSSYKEAMKSLQQEEWSKAMQSELESMQKNKVWQLVALPEGSKPIGCKWVYKTKKDSKGNVERLKARLVAKGYTQQEGVDYNETFSPVSTKDSFRFVMALVAHYDLFLHQMDVKTAFLNGKLEEEIYMKQPEGFVNKGEEKLVCKLNKSIYGLKQASRQWYLRFDEVMQSHGFIENSEDECIYVKTSGRHFTILVLYVDDILIAGTNLSILQETKILLSDTFEMKDMGEASYVLGIEITRDRRKGLLGLSQTGYIDKILKRFNMSSCNGSEVPVTKGDKLSKEQSPKTDMEKKEMEDKPYASVVGSLMYAQVCTRPDISFALSLLGRYQSNPGQAHWIAAKKVIRYLQKTKDYKLVYRKGTNLEIVGYCDSDFAGCQDSMKSTSSYIFMMAGGAISWKSMKQKNIATSTMMAEYMACFEATSQAVWIGKFVERINILNIVIKPLQIFCDNTAAVFYSKNNKRSSGTKHMHIKYRLVREKIKQGLVKINYIDTASMLADPLNKALPVAVFKKHVKNMGLIVDFDMLS